MSQAEQASISTPGDSEGVKPLRPGTGVKRPTAPICAPDAEEALRRLRESGSDEYAEMVEETQRGVNDAINTLTELLADIDADREIASTLKGLVQARSNLRWLSIHGDLKPLTERHEAEIRAGYEAGTLPAEPTVDNEGAHDGR